MGPAIVDHKNKSLAAGVWTGSLLNLMKAAGIAIGSIWLISHFVFSTGETQKKLAEIVANQVAMQISLTELTSQMNNHLGWTDARNDALDRVLESHDKRLDRLEAKTIEDQTPRPRPTR